MANTYTWTVTAMNCYPTYESQSNVVFTVHYTVSAVSSQTHTVTNPDGTTSTVPYTASINNTCQVTYVAGSSFTPYAQLTNAEVVGWVQAQLGTAGVTSAETTLDTLINNQINPPVTTPPLPW